jgi:hypothetical protein
MFIARNIAIINGISRWFINGDITALFISDLQKTKVGSEFRWIMSKMAYSEGVYCTVFHLSLFSERLAAIDS